MADPRETHPNADKAAGYVRLSSLPPEHAPFSPGNQRRMNQERADQLGLKLVREFCDLDKSASKRERYREGYEAMVDALIAREFQTAIVPKLDRLSRRGMGQVGMLLDRIEEIGGRMLFIADGLDTWEPGARQVIAILAEQARGEADAISWRIAEWHAHNRREGRWVHGRQFGLRVENAKLAPHPTEAPIVRMIVDDFLAGASFRALAAKLNQLEIPPPRMTQAEEARARGRRAKGVKTHRWGYGTIRNMLKSPALAALAGHGGELVRNGSGELVLFGKGVISVAEHHRITEELGRRSTVVKQSPKPGRVGRKTGAGRPNKYLLGGFAKCALCGIRMNAYKRTVGGADYVTFRCTERAQGKGCPGCSVQNRPLVREVYEQYSDRLAALKQSDPLLGAVAELWTSYTMPDQEVDRKVLDDALVDIEARVGLLYQDRYERGLFHESEDVARWERMLTSAREQRAAVKEQLDALGPRPKPDIGLLRDMVVNKEAWLSTPVQRQRELLGMAVQSVLVLPSEKGAARRYVHDRTRVVWVNEDEEAARLECLRQRGLTPVT